MRQDSSYFDLKKSARPADGATDDVGCGTAGEGFRMGANEHGFVEFAPPRRRRCMRRNPGTILNVLHQHATEPHAHVWVGSLPRCGGVEGAHAGGATLPRP
jgi:hypothetical protein